MPPFSLTVLRRTAHAAALSAAILALAACDTAKERAAKHYENGMALLEAGDIDRALVEFRNVFKLDGSHREARRAYAQAEQSRGRMREAYAQYLRLIEQYPDDVDALRELANIAVQSNEWGEAERHATAGLAIAPQDKGLLAAKAGLDYGKAKTAGDLPAMADAAATAVALRKDLPENSLLGHVIIDNALSREDYDTALAVLDEMVAASPDDISLWGLQLSTLAAKGDNARVEARLNDMVARFPNDPSVGETLVRWHVSQNEPDKAEAFLRGRADDPAETGVLNELNLIRFLAENRSPEAAIADLDKLIAKGENANIYRSTRAGLLFDLGREEESIQEMETILASAEPSEDTRKIKVGYARMQIARGNPVGARKYIEEVLAEDPDDLDAIKLKAGLLISNDEVAEAISVLRRAIEDHARDPELYTLMAQAHERDGNPELMREMLSLSVEASGRAPGESLRYAQALVAVNETLAAETVLIDALRLSPGLPDLLVPLGQLYIDLRDWPRAEAVATELESLKDDRLANVTAGLRAAIFEGQQKTDQAIGYLQGLVDQGKGGVDIQIAILRSHLAAGRLHEALSYAQTVLAANPTDPSLRFINASVQSAAGQNAEAEATFRELLAEDPTRAQVWMALFRIVASDPARQAEAPALIDEALVSNPNVAELLWAKAGFLERESNIDAAISVYEDLYAADSTNLIVANNLASLISSHRNDAESLNRAEVIARRLRGSDMAPFQDTYGWIAYRLGRYDDARAELEKAAAGLPDDPTVQYHLAMTYLALSQRAEAAALFERVVSMVPADDSRAFAVSARDELAKLEAAGVTANN